MTVQREPGRPLPSVSVDGSPLQETETQSLEEVLVDDSLTHPDMFVLRFRDPNGGLLGRTGLRIGAEVVITVSAEGSDGSLITGEVTALEAEYDDRGAVVVVRGYDKSHRLHHGRRTATYADSSYDEIARQIADRHGLQDGQIDSAPGTHPLVSQVNLTDWEMLRACAREIGFDVRVVDGKLDFCRAASAANAPGPGDPSEGTARQLTLGRNLFEFRPRISAAEQVPRVRVRGWDMQHKRAVIGEAQAGTTAARLRDDPASLAQRFQAPDFVNVDIPLTAQAEADGTAAAIAEAIGSSFAEAEGSAVGSPDLRAGTSVTVSAVDDAFCGDYTLTATRHVFGTHGYRTHFVVGGRSDRSTLGLATLGATSGTRAAAGPPVYGVVVAVVTDINDPSHLGRVKLSFPWLDDSYVTEWARVALPGVGTTGGLMMLPEVNDEVLVAFQNGDVRLPYVLGGLFNGVDTPVTADTAVDSTSGALQRRAMVSRTGQKLVLFDEQGSEGLALISGDGGYRIALRQAGTTIHVASNGSVHIEAQQDVHVRAGTDLTLEANGRLTLSGAQVQVSANGPVQVSGHPIQLN